jgi:MFS family permease
MEAKTPENTSAEEKPMPAAVGGAYAWYVLALLIVVYAVSLIDRQIIAILAVDIKRDLDLTDAELGLLYGTVFAIFYALFGVPLGRLADGWVRKWLLSLGLAGWSLMTMLSGFAGSFIQLALPRLGVGIGEASTNPAAVSLLSDYFPKKQRGTAMGFYYAGVPIGLGASLSLGGVIVDAWNSRFPDGNAPLGLAGWQAAFIAAAIPGFLLALWVATLREPLRGIADGVVQAKEPKPFTKAWGELTAVFPPLNFLHLAGLKAKRIEWLRSITVLLVIVSTAWALVALTTGLTPPDKLRVIFAVGNLKVTSHVIQWATFALGAYSVYSWAQSQRLRDPPTHALIFGSPTMLLILLAAGFNLFIAYGLAAWGAAYSVVTYGVSLGAIGLRIGIISAISGIIGTPLGGLLADTWHRHSPRGRLYLVLVSVFLQVPLAIYSFDASTFDGFIARLFVTSIVISFWAGGIISTMQELVLPRMRGVTSAAFGICATIVGLGTGPYLVGFVSDATGSLKTGVMSVFLVAPIVWVSLIMVTIRLTRTLATTVERARAAGEPI